MWYSVCVGCNQLGKKSSKHNFPLPNLTSLLQYIPRYYSNGVYALKYMLCILPCDDGMQALPALLLR